MRLWLIVYYSKGCKINELKRNARWRFVQALLFVFK